MTEAHKTDNYWNNFKKPYPADKFFTKLIWNLSDQKKPATRVVLWEKVFLEISQNSQENTCARVSF